MSGNLQALKLCDFFVRELPGNPGEGMFIETYA